MKTKHWIGLLVLAVLLGAGASWALFCKEQSKSSSDASQTASGQSSGRNIVVPIQDPDTPNTGSGKKRVWHSPESNRHGWLLSRTASRTSATIRSTARTTAATASSDEFRSCPEFLPWMRNHGPPGMRLWHARLRRPTCTKVGESEIQPSQ